LKIRVSVLKSGERDERRQRRRRVASCREPELSSQPSRPALRSCAPNARDSRVRLAPTRRREVKRKREERKKTVRVRVVEGATKMVRMR
jgi:hypothetical protein